MLRWPSIFILHTSIAHIFIFSGVDIGFTQIPLGRGGSSTYFLFSLFSSFSWHISVCIATASKEVVVPETHGHWGACHKETP